MTGTSLALHGTVTLSLLTGLPAVRRAARPGRPEPDGPPRWWCGPGVWLAVITGLLVINQVLFTVYALVVHRGDMSYLDGYIPDGWFVLADGPAMRWLAGHFPAPELLAACLMRIPSLLELPFGMLAYLTVVNWLDPRLYHRLTGLTVLALTSASYSLTFALIEWAMDTPYLWQNLILRGVSAVVTALALHRLGRLRATPPGTAAPRTAGELLAFAAATAALGFLVLALYDSVLLYSLGKAGAHVPGALAAAAVLAAARVTAAHLRRRTRTAPAGPGIDTLTTALSWWLAFFLVPALAIRYELGFGSALLTAAAGLLVVGTATAVAATEVYQRLPVDGRSAAARRWLLGLAVAVLVAAVLAAAALAVPADHTETRLLRAAALFTLAATAVSALWDRRARPRFRVT